MTYLTISEVAKRSGIRPSAIRYYEQIGILPQAKRVNKRRSYEAAVYYRLAVIHRARQTGFTLREIRELLSGFSENVPPSRRWREMANRKLSELESMLARIREMQRLLLRLQHCQCESLETCGEKMFEAICASRRPG